MENEKSDFSASAMTSELLREALIEKRRQRRWGIFFKGVFMLYVVALTIGLWVDGETSAPGLDTDHVAVVKVEGEIGVGTADTVNNMLNSAFKEDTSKAVILHINSPGGSAAESNRIYKEIRRLRADHPNKKVYSVVGDMAASGGYFIASATDSIYADETSMVGSIGVIYAGFGFVESIKKLGIERRILTAGANKNMLDPFSPQKPQDADALRVVLKDIYDVFVTAVKVGRGDRLVGSDESIFSGKVFKWRRG